ncbi:MAG TPA: SDR family oxidoreductase [Rectinemataceae bacterium]|nr:SDR family oxidoreductase [Rectinemataceae bacterium]
MEKMMQNKVVVITGGSRGLGLAIAQALGAAGAKVFLCSRSADSVDKAVAKLCADGVDASGAACDVSALSEVEAIAAKVVATYGRIDVWINNAGLSAPWGPTAHIPSERFHALVGTNIIGTYNGSVTAVRRFLEQGGGKLINVLGRGDNGSVPKQNAYTSSKAWVWNFTKSLAAEYKGTGVEIHGFNPGMVRTEMLSEVEAVRGWEKELEALKTVTAVLGNDAGVPAAKALWLASGATDGKTGLMVKVITKGFMVRRGLATLGRLVTGRGLGAKEISITRVEPAAKT